MKTKTLKTNWTKGEVSPLMFGRVDTEAYSNGAAAVSNMIVKQQGGLWSRPGTKFIGEVKYSTRKTIIREFEFSDVQAYILEIGYQYIRIWYDGGFVETTPGSGTPLEIVTPYQEADLDSLHFAQSADILFVVHSNYAPMKIERLGANNWTIAQVVTSDGPYLSQPQTSTCRFNFLADSCLLMSPNPIFTVTTGQKAITGIASSGNAIQLTVPAHGYSNGTSICVAQVGGCLEANGRWSVSAATTNTLVLHNTAEQIDSFFVNAWTSGGYVSLDPATPLWTEYLKEGIWNLVRLTQVVSTTVSWGEHVQPVFALPTGVSVIAASGTLTSDHAGTFSTSCVGKYVRITDNSWWKITGFVTDDSVTATSITVIQYTPPNNSNVSISNRLITYRVISDTAIFASTDTGRLLRFNINGTQLPGSIYSYVLSTVVVASLTDRFPLNASDTSRVANNGTCDTWRIGAWSATTGWPRTVVFHQQRLTFGGSTAEPQTLWFSCSADYYNFAPTQLDSTIQDNNGITYTLVSAKANPIQWLLTGPVLLIGTLGGEWKVNASSAIDAPITPTNILIKPQTEHGTMQGSTAYRIGYAYLFLQRAGRKVIELTYNFQLDSYTGQNLCVVSEHILRQGVQGIHLTHQQEPNNLLWVVLADGTMACLTYEKEQQVTAWHRHSLGGGGLVEWSAAIPSADGTEDLLYLLVNRTINGVTKRYIEMMTPDFFASNPQDKNTNMFYVDCGQIYSGSPTTTISGLNYLQGQTVVAVADGNAVAPQTVTAGGQITLPVAASNVIVGLSYTALVKNLPLDFQSRDGGSVVGRPKRIDRLAVRVYQSIGFKHGVDLTNLDEVSFRDTTTAMNQSPDLFTGDKIVSLSNSYGLQGQYYLVQDNPYPLVILAVGPDVSVGS